MQPSKDQSEASEGTPPPPTAPLMAPPQPRAEPIIAHAPSFLNSATFRTELGAPADWTDPCMPFNPSALPPLPEIPHSEIARLAVRHKTVAYQYYLTSTELPPRYGATLDTYELLEGIGDAYLTSAVSRILRQLYPDLPTGPLFVSSVAPRSRSRGKREREADRPGQDLRERLVRNDTISWLALHYNLPSRLEFDAVTNMRLKQSIAADLFEAHIGGLIEFEDRERKSTTLDEWLKGVFHEDVWTSMRETKDGLKLRKVEQEVMRLEHRRLKKAKHIARWECSLCDDEPQRGDQAKFLFDTLDPAKGWHAKLYVDGEFVSCGHSKFKKEAEVAAGVNHARRLKKAR
ncbi:ribonuclease III domain-containing protein [Sporobolomyces koalae]|uniref:ribonuclease III domain-containing protein n=1 Tax=Sporobolomyces koalae TaxID=500713 RepID=UPI00316D7485